MEKAIVNKLTDHEIAKVFAMYLGCDVVVFETLYSVHKQSGLRKLGMQIIDGISIDIHEAVTLGKKLLLTPLDKITDEQKVELLKVYGHKEPVALTLFSQTVQDWEYKLFTGICSKCFQWAIKEGIDVPLWVGIDHWANGKTAIELGIAIDKTLIF